MHTSQKAILGALAATSAVALLPFESTVANAAAPERGEHPAYRRRCILLTKAWRSRRNSPSCCAPVVRGKFVWPTDWQDYTTGQTVVPGFRSLPFTGSVGVERYLIDINTSSVAKFIDASQAPDFTATNLTRVEACSGQWIHAVPSCCLRVSSARQPYRYGS